jgi:tRNA(adenine34) deaminase
VSRRRLDFQFVSHVQHKILGPAHRGDHPVGERFFQFGFACTSCLRTCEVFFQSGGAADRHGAADADKLSGSGVKNFFILEIEDFFPDFHGVSSGSMVLLKSTTDCCQREQIVSFAKADLHAILPVMRDDSYWMGKALAQADRAARLGEVPIGAVLVRDDRVIGRGCNLREGKNDPSAHAEMIAIRQAAGRLNAWRLTGTTLYVTLEPCPMCMGAIILARIERLVFGCYDPKAGAAGSLYNLAADSRFNHRVAVSSGVREEECSAILSDFFRDLRRRKKESRANVVDEQLNFPAE